MTNELEIVVMMTEKCSECEVSDIKPLNLIQLQF